MISYNYFDDLNLKKGNHDTSLEYVFVKDNGNELWEIDYRRNIALEVSEIIKPESIDNLITYSGKIETFLQNERGCKNIHFHYSFSLPKRIHLMDQNSKLRGCSFN
jgi:hypothetical protein